MYVRTYEYQRGFQWTDFYEIRYWGNFIRCVFRACCRYSDWLRAGWSGDRIPVVARISAPVHTSPGAHPACYTGGKKVKVFRYKPDVALRVPGG